uniref:Uncharacterized protein n=1 Tax=Vitis vinifera TaxID=29760 RepID=A5B2L8_VITVI|nr:hypothetical protein VITISV_025246 [Vitis vinifera]
MVRSLALRQEVRVWPNQGSTCLAQAIVRLMHRNPQTALAQSKHPYSIFDSGCSHSTAKRQWQFRKFTTYSHTINSKIKPNLSLLYATFSVSALEPSAAGENLGHLLFPVHKLLEEIVNGGATDPFACFALGDWTSSQHSVSYCAGMGFASGWFSGKLKGKVTGVDIALEALLKGFCPCEALWETKCTWTSADAPKHV